MSKLCFVIINFCLKQWMTIIGIIIFIIVYAQVFWFDFICYDDYLHITQNSFINTGDFSSLPRIWTASLNGLFIPVTYTLWLLEAKFSFFLWGVLNSGVFHVVSIILHMSVAFMAYAFFAPFVEKINHQKLRIALFIFSIHPMGVETTSWISEQKGLLCSLFGLSSMIYFEKGNGQLSRIKSLLFSGVFFLLALLSKPIAIVFPLVSLILSRDWISFKKRLQYLTVPLLISIIIGIVMPFLQPASSILNVISFNNRFFVALDTVGFYIIKFFIPYPLSIDYGRNPIVISNNFINLYFIIGIIFFAVIVWKSIKSKSPPLPLKLTLCAFMLIVPNLGFIPFAFQDYSTVADRYTYLPYLFICIALFVENRFVKSRAIYFLFVVLIPLFSFLSYNRIRIWENSKSLMQNTFTNNPNSLIATSNLAYLAEVEGQLDEALGWYDKSNKISPSGASINGIGVILIRKKEFAKAINLYTKLIKIRPTFAVAYLNLGIAFESLGNKDEAKAAFAKAYEIDKNIYVSPNHL